MSWTTGLTRLYILVVIGWVMYWFLWIPFDEMRLMKKHAESVVLYDPDKLKEYQRQANLGVQFSENWHEMTKNPLATFVVVGMPPLIGYGLLRLVILISRWVASGFLNDE